MNKIILLTATVCLLGVTAFISFYGPSDTSDVANEYIYATSINLRLTSEQAPSTTPMLFVWDTNGNLLEKKELEDSFFVFRREGDTFLTTRMRDPEDFWNGVAEIRDLDFKVIQDFQVKSVDYTSILDFIHTKRDTFLLLGYGYEEIEDQLVEYLLIEEQDRDENVLFSWSSLDHIPVKKRHFQEIRKQWLDQNVNDYVHANSVFEDYEGDLLVSSRHLNQVFLIDKNTGEISWRLGGVDSDFRFINDPHNGFSHQHNATQLESGNILLYDNGNEHQPSQSRVVEYALDFENMTATLVWSYEIPGKFTYAAGGTQRLPNGNTLITWGLESELSGVRISEVTENGDDVLNLYIPPESGIYRAYKYIDK